jgi:hypothetical protein
VKPILVPCVARTGDLDANGNCQRCGAADQGDHKAASSHRFRYRTVKDKLRSVAGPFDPPLRRGALGRAVAG